MRLEDIVVSGSSVEIRTLTRGNALTNQVQQRLIDLRFLDPPVDGDFGPLPQLALQEFGEAIGVTADLTLQPALARGLIESDADRLLPIAPKSNLAGRVFRYKTRKGFYFARLPSHLNIVYVEGVTKSGTPNDNRPNVFNDRRMVLTIEAGVPIELGNWAATTEPGKDFTEMPLNPLGAARIAFGQYKAWRVGIHNVSKPSGHEALVQVDIVRVHRDLNKDFKRDGRRHFRRQ